MCSAASVHSLILVYALIASMSPVIAYPWVRTPVKRGPKPLYDTRHVVITQWASWKGDVIRKHKLVVFPPAGGPRKQLLPVPVDPCSGLAKLLR